LSDADADRIEGYAGALLAVAKGEGVVDRASDELFTFAREYERNHQLRSTMTDQQVAVEVRQGIIEELLGTRASPLSATLAGLIVGTGRARDLVAIVDRFVAMAAAERQREVAEIRSSVPLDRAQQERLAQALSSALKKQVEVKVVVDPAVMGGVVATVGDTVIDGSVRHRLEKLREVL